MPGRMEPSDPRIDPFEEHSDRYENWFERHGNAYHAEVRALAEVTPQEGIGIEVGVGTGRFAAPLGIPFGVDPSTAMLRVARARGIQVVRGTGEALPFATGSVDVVLMVTTVCFVEDLDRALGEARRVLRPRGSVVVGLVDRASPLGAEYLAKKEESLFYRAARFYTVEEILQALVSAGFGTFETRQTLFGPPAHTPSNETVKPGHGEGSFVAVRGRVSAEGSQRPPSLPAFGRAGDPIAGKDGEG